MADKQLTLGTLFKADATELYSVLEKVKTQLAGLSSGLKTTTSETQKATTATKNVTESYNGLNKQLSKVHGGVERLAAAFKVTASYGVAATAIYSVVTAFKSGLQAIVDYDQGLKNLQAITGATDAEVTAMGETIKSVARDTKFSTTEVASGMTLLGQAGLTAGESIAAMHDTAMLATGTLSDMKTSTDLVSTTIRAFNLSATDSGRIVDVMANAMNKSKLDIDKLRTAFNYVGATAHQTGLSLEETSATMMTLSNAGLRASTIGTGLRQVLSRVVKPSESMAGALAQVGMTMDQLNPATVGWTGTVQALTSILYDSNTKTVDMAKAFQLFGLRGAQAAAVIVQAYVSGHYQEAMDSVYEIGAAQQMAGIQAEGLGLKLKNLQDRAKNVAVAFGEAGATGAIGVFLDAVRTGLVVMESFAGSIAGKVIFQLGALGVAYKTATLAGSTFMALFGNVAPIKILTSTFATLTTTLGRGGLVAALTTAAYAVEALFVAFGPMKLILAGVAAAVLAYRAALQQQIKDAELAVVENDKVVKSLQSYQFALNETAKKVLAADVGTRNAEIANNAYIATLERLIKDHPELAGKIQLTTAAIDQNNKSINDFLSDARIEKMRSLITLQAEYNAQMERTQVWSGYLTSLSQGLTILWNDIKGIVGKINEWDNAITETEIAFLTFVQNQLEKLPVVGELMSGVVQKYKDWKQITSDFFIDSAKWWAEYFADLGRASEESKAAADKMKAVWDEIAQGFINAEGQAAKSFGAIKRELEAMTVNGKTLSDEAIGYIIKKLADLTSESQRQIAEIKKATETATNEMNAAWQAYYNQQDERGAYEVKTAWERLQKQAKDYADHLAERVQAGKISAEQMQTELEKWWDEELSAYIAKEEKKVEAAGKTADKVEKVHEKLAEKIKSLEEKLAEDLKLIRQAEYTEQEKTNEDLESARQALADAKQAIAEAETEKEKAEAIKQLDDVRAKYRKILDMANEVANAKEKIGQKQTAQEATITSSLYEYWKKYYQDIGYQLTTYTSTYIEKEDKRVAKAKDSTKKIKAEVEAGLKEIGRLANEIELELDEEKPINVTNTEAIKALDETDKKHDALRKDVKAEKPLNVSTTEAVSNIQRAIDKIKELIAWIAKIPRSVTININVKTKKTEEQSFDDGVANASSAMSNFTNQVEKGATYPVSFVGSGSATKPLSEKIDDIGGDIGQLQNSIESGAAFSADFSNLSEGAASSAESMVSSFSSAFERVIVKLDELIEKFNRGLSLGDGLIKIESRLAQSGFSFQIPGKYEVRYIDPKTGETVYWDWQYQRKGGPIPELSGGARIPGYGGGDTVPAMLERGEYVINKSAVQKYGTGFFDLLNSMVAKFAVGGSVPNSKVEVALIPPQIPPKRDHTTQWTFGHLAHQYQTWQDDPYRPLFLSQLGLGRTDPPWNESYYFDKWETLRDTAVRVGTRIGGVYKREIQDLEAAAEFTKMGGRLGDKRFGQRLYSSFMPALENLETRILNNIVQVWDTIKGSVNMPDEYQDEFHLGGLVGDVAKFAKGGLVTNLGSWPTSPETGTFRRWLADPTKPGLFYEDALELVLGLYGQDIKGRSDYSKGLRTKAGKDIISHWLPDLQEKGFADPIKIIDAQNIVNSAAGNWKRFMDFVQTLIGDAYDNAIKSVLGDDGFKSWKQQAASGLMKRYGMQTGGHIPGFGGGDTVPALLERGEYVIRKEAVQSYGTGLMNAINSGMAKFMAGGIVKPQIVFDQPMPKFASGGQVAGATSMYPASSSGVPINITISPMFMTGDKNSMRQAAETLRTELKNIDHRYGVA